METKTFEALTMKEGLIAIKKELGPNAVLLSTTEKTMKEGGKKYFELTASALDRSSQTSNSERSYEQEIMRLGNKISSLEDYTRKIFDLISTSSIQSLEREIKDLKNIASKSEIFQFDTENLNLHPAMKKVINLLYCIDINKSFLKDLSEHLQSSDLEFGDSDIENDRLVKNAAARYMLQYIDIAPVIINPPASGNIHLFTGSSGSGVSTVIAKLINKLPENVKSGTKLVSFKNQKLGGSEFLSILAKLSGANHVSIDNMKTLENLILDTPSKDQIIIDYNIPEDSKVAHKDFSDIQSINALLNFHLIIPVNRKESVNQESIHQLSKFGIESVIYSFCDQLSSYADIFNYSYQYSLPISYQCYGNSASGPCIKVAKIDLLKKLFGEIANS